MVEHDELMRRAVEGLRASRSPAAGAEERVLAALELQLGGPSGGGDSAPTSTAAPATVRWVLKVIGAIVGMTAGGLSLVLVGVGMLRGAEDPPTRDEVVAVAEPADTGVSREQPSSHAEAGEQLGVIAVKPGALQKPRVDPPAEVEPVDTLAAELALIEAAKLASSPSATLEQLDRHAREHANGSMASEREALAVVALCQLDRQQEARARARSLVAKRPGLPLLQRMRSECPVLTDLLRQTTP